MANVPEWELSADMIEQTKVCLAHRRRPRYSWHNILNQTTSCRPEGKGGPVVDRIEDHVEYAKIDEKMYTCTLVLHNSYKKGDQIQLVAEGTGRTKADAAEDACCKALVLLMFGSLKYCTERDACGAPIVNVVLWRHQWSKPALLVLNEALQRLGSPERCYMGHIFTRASGNWLAERKALGVVESREVLSVVKR